MLPLHKKRCSADSMWNFFFEKNPEPLREQLMDFFKVCEKKHAPFWVNEPLLVDMCTIVVPTTHDVVLLKFITLYWMCIDPDWWVFDKLRIKDPAYVGLWGADHVAHAKEFLARLQIAINMTVTFSELGQINIDTVVCEFVTNAHLTYIQC